MVTLHPTVIVTGATGAIGSATAGVLVGRGARVLLLARPSSRLEALVRRLGGADKRVDSIPVDLSSMASVRSAAKEINRSGDHVDAMLNIAAVFSPRYQKTAEGIELMLATNHLGPFLLTNLLRDRLIRAGRVITVSAPSTTRVDLDRLQDKYRFDALHTFGATKAANLMFTFELARRAHRWDIRANAFHPGLVRSELMRDAPAPLRMITRWISRSADRAAEDLAELALSPAHAGTTGWFFKGTQRIDPPKQTQDAGLQGALWKRSADLVELNNAGF
jgi:NAD(P)-dependent dehydrogenase (short-subunit alcohol dehydrogenase family)